MCITFGNKTVKRLRARTFKNAANLVFFFFILGQSEELYKSQKAEIAEIVEDFYSNFTEAYSRLRKKHKRQFRMYHILARQQGEQRSKNGGNALSKKSFEQSHAAILY